MIARMIPKSEAKHCNAKVFEYSMQSSLLNLIYSPCALYLSKICHVLDCSSIKACVMLL